ncbi:alpha-glucosidase [Actinoplanes lobatus]|uniref:Alpha-glucosidase n=1 Tax=Actinoplanes lobatus TaxID=113568 RepID=A0A7W7HME4_9ACTN|nr:glycoside hydrolase family 13 protein [Actinoplanes lobatus]MBB4753193.1 alpha-glucosidase [Actinoplanes lobatus]GGN59072.1 alpha-glucosidase [Actinoplanes lobatus]GIE42946.1 alpha-glucosidase [Actinoplanes lobatus]
MPQHQWWRDAVIYQVYVRSFADANGDGVGDLAGVRQHLPYLAELGVDALWFNPWYASPQADAGYDVSDYRAIDPLFGDLSSASALIAEAHELGLKVIIDVVPNHVSDQHPWFVEAVAAGPGSPLRDRFWFRPGRGDLPPNDWQSVFGGPAWTQIADGEWYLHLFAPEQPDLNWTSPDVAAEHSDVLRFWFDRGADGVRIDSATMPAKDPSLADFDPADPPLPHPYIDRDAVHDIYRSWRAVADTYEPPRALIGEIWLDKPDRLALYLRPDEMHTAFNFDYLNCAWDPKALRHVIDATLDAHAPVDAPATWVLSNHDVTRHVTRYGRADSSYGHALRQHGTSVDLPLGARRARAALLLNLALPGSVYLYQGEELGLEEVEDIPNGLRQDPIFHRTGGLDIGRDGCRVPLPWSGDQVPFGFSPDDAAASPWLPQPAAWAGRTAEAQAGDPNSMLSLYRTAIALRRRHLTTTADPRSSSFPSPPSSSPLFEWLPTDPSLLAFTRAGGFTFLANLSDQPVRLPPHDEILLASGPLLAGLVPPDTAIWLRTA